MGLIQYYQITCQPVNQAICIFIIVPIVFCNFVSIKCIIVLTLELYEGIVTTRLGKRLPEAMLEISPIYYLNKHFLWSYVCCCRRLGFDMYLLSALEGPPAVLSYLCKTYQLHNIPVAEKEGVDIQSLPSDIVRFYIGKQV